MAGVKAVFIYGYEFGYEMTWQAAVRKFSNEFESIYICTFPGREALYKDFADRVFTFTSDVLDTFDIAHPETLNRPMIERDLKRQGVGDDYEIHYTHEHDFFGRHAWNDLVMNGEYIDFPNSRPIVKKDFVTITPRLNVTHPHRNYPVESLAKMLRLLAEKYTIRVVLFAPIPEQLSEFTVIQYPTVQEQIDLHSESKALIYAHCGGCLLSLFNPHKTPLFMYTADTDLHFYINPEHIIFNEIPQFKALDHTMTLDELPPELIVSEFNKFYETI